MNNFVDRRNTASIKNIHVTLEGPQGTNDTVSLAPIQYAAILNLIDARIKEIEGQVAWRVRPHLSAERDAWIEILCTIDI
jgi:hypothetical protein